jgi:hypothetical protein
MTDPDIGGLSVNAISVRPSLRYLRIATSALSFTACVLLLVLWVRSYYVEDRASLHARGVGLRFYSSRGWLVCSKSSDPNVAQNYPWSLELGVPHWIQPGDERLRFRLPLELLRGAAYADASIPHWLPALAAGVLTLALAVPFRFSLRTLLVGTTLLAILLGILVITA